MDIELNKEIEGIKLRYIRDVLKKVRSDNVSADDLANRLGVASEHGERLVNALCTAGYLELSDRPNTKPARYEITVQGNALCMATMRKRVTRAEAETILHKLRQRILEINDDPQYLYVVSKVAVFGSYASGKADLGDIDLAIELKARPPLTKKEVVAQSIERAERSGKARNFLAKLAFGQNEVLKELQAVSRRLSIHGMSELEHLQLPSEVMFEG